MSGRASRRKGATGEREIAALLNAHGFTCRRDGRLDTDLDHDCAGYHFEIKRRERIDLPAWIRQAESEANGDIPIVAYRTNGEPWRAVLPFDALARLLALTRDLEADEAVAVDPRVIEYVPGPSASELARAATLAEGSDLHP